MLEPATCPLYQILVKAALDAHHQIMHPEMTEHHADEADKGEEGLQGSR